MATSAPPSTRRSTTRRPVVPAPPVITMGSPIGRLPRTGFRSRLRAAKGVKHNERVPIVAIARDAPIAECHDGDLVLIAGQTRGDALVLAGKLQDHGLLGRVNRVEREHAQRQHRAEPRELIGEGGEAVEPPGQSLGRIGKLKDHVFGEEVRRLRAR